MIIRDANQEPNLYSAFLHDSTNLVEIGKRWESYSVKASSIGDGSGTQTAFSMNLISAYGVERFKYTIRIPMIVTEIPLLKLFDIDWMVLNAVDLWDDVGVIDAAIAALAGIPLLNIVRMRFSDVAGTNYLGRGVNPATGAVTGIAASTSSSVMANGLVIGVGA